MGDSSERLCVVTGTSSGIGRAVAEAALAAGWQVVGVARREPTIANRSYRHLRLDLADAAAVQARFEQELGGEVGLARYARVGLVNNAAVVEPVGPTSRLPALELARAFLVNGAAPIWLMGYFLSACRGRPLRIVNVSSGAARRAYAGWSAYCSTKAALRMAGQVVEAEAGGYPPGTALPRDVAVVSFEPGVVDTAMQAAVRSLPARDFPLVQHFMDLHARGALVPPGRPASEIVGLLQRDDLPHFSEMRLGG